MREVRMVVAALLVAFVIGTVAAGNTDPPVSDAFKTKPQSVAVFKDGYGFFLREGKASLYDGWCMTDYIPRATAGTFWFYTSEPGTKVVTVRSTGKNEIRFEDVNELAASLRRKIGLTVNVATEDVTVEGKLKRVLDDLILVEADKQVRVVELADVKSARVIGQPLLLEVAGVKKVDQATVNMGYLQQGITWVPTYTVELLSPDESRVILRGTITNGVEDLRDCRVYLVVGVPNFSMKGQIDPLSVHAIGDAVLKANLAKASAVQTLSNAMRADLELMREAGDIEVPLIQVPVEALQELYFYEEKDLDILAGDTVMTTIMDETVPYRSLFTWNASAGKDVYHYIVMKNEMDVPFTTGPAMVIQGDQAISQDLLKYVPPGAEGRLKLTLATDVRTESTEKEIERRAYEKIDSITYIPVVTQGTLRVENHRKDAIKVEITKSVQGKVIEATDDAEIHSTLKTNEGLNPTSNMKWTVDVQPGKEKALTYTYLRYVRARAS